jgi:hypothetical protein
MLFARFKDTLLLMFKKFKSSNNKSILNLLNDLFYIYSRFFLLCYHIVNYNLSVV